MTSFLVCPECRGTLLGTPSAFECARCGRRYPVIDEVPHFDPPSTADAVADSPGGSRDLRRSYWDRGWAARSQHDHAFLNELNSRAEWHAHLESERAALRERRHVSVVELNREAVNGQVVLDIGCGAGISGPLLGNLGAQYIGLDHSPHAASSTLRYLRAAGGDGFTIQGNAEALPLRDASVDVVYSNGVLHHTPNFSTAMDEAYRVLKPGGRAIIGLYATYSTAFGLVRMWGAMKGNLTRRSMDRWMSAASEGAWRTGNRFNPWTRTFSRGQLERVARGYAVHALEIRKNGNPVAELPWLGRRLMRFSAVRKIDRALEQVLGSMLIMSFSKEGSAPR